MSTAKVSAYRSWVDALRSGESPPTLREDIVVKTENEFSFQTTAFTNTERDHYTSEVGIRGDDFLYHFYPRDKEFRPNFQDCLAQAFLDVFQRKERLHWDYVPELNSWAVLARGYASNPLARDAAMRVFSVLDSLL